MRRYAGRDLESWKWQSLYPVPAAQDPPKSGTIGLIPSPSPAPFMAESSHPRQLYSPVTTPAHACEPSIRSSEAPISTGMASKILANFRKNNPGILSLMRCDHKRLGISYCAKQNRIASELVIVCQINLRVDERQICAQARKPATTSKCRLGDGRTAKESARVT